jgi:hypothetical protein
MKKLWLLIPLLFSLASAPAWAFPDNGVLDNFTGADGTTPPSANWTNSVFVGAFSSGCYIQDNAAATNSTGTDCDMYRNVATFTDMEAYFTIVDTANTAAGQLYGRLVNIGANTTDGYRVEWIDGTSVIDIHRIDNGVGTKLGASISQAITTTDKVGLKIVGAQICVWFSDSGGAWTELSCRTDATYGSAGYIGMGVNGNSVIGAVDDFGGGAVATTRRAGQPLFLGE